jgi:hypothetical protein
LGSSECSFAMSALWSAMAAIVCIGVTVVVAGAPLVSVDELAKFGRALSRAKQVQMFRCGDQAAAEAGGRQTGDEARRGT